MTRHDETTLRLATQYAMACTTVRIAGRTRPLTSGEYQQAALGLERDERNADAARKALLWHAGRES